MALVVGTERDVTERAATIEGVKEIFGVTGDIDLIAVVEVPGMEDLNKVISELRRIDGVQATDTHIVLTRTAGKGGAVWTPTL
ncbi:MAG: Lrp/AsnC ligand binding domain-containing protein [Candidatus Bathyarchaeia archaeon]